MRTLIVGALLAGLTLTSQAATYRLSSPPARQVEHVELQSKQSQQLTLPAQSDPVELMPTRGRAPGLNDLQLNLGEYPGEQNPYVMPEGTNWPYPMSAPTYDGHYHLPGGQW